MKDKMIYIRKRIELFRLIDKIKLWPSRSGMLHGIRSIERTGDTARITTHCNREFFATNSRNSRAARWLRNKLAVDFCPACRIPGWKIEKFTATRFSRHQGSHLVGNGEPQQSTSRGQSPRVLP